MQTNEEKIKDILERFNVYSMELETSILDKLESYLINFEKNKQKALDLQKQQMIEKGEGLINTKDHICRFNDGDCNCDCFNAGVTDYQNLIKE